MAIVCANLCSKVKVKNAAKTVSDSDCVFSIGLSIQADNEVGLAQVCLVVLYVMNEILNFTFFTTLNRNGALGMAEAKTLARFNRKQGGEKSVSIVRGASSVHSIILDNWVAGVCVPSLTEGLLVHMPVH